MTGPNEQISRAEFEEEVYDAVLRAYAGGADVDGSFTVMPPVGTLPGWEVTISRVDGAVDTETMADVTPDNPASTD